MQHTPTVSRADVERIVTRDYPEPDRAEALQILANYGGQTHHRENDRGHLDTLKLAAGDIESLRREVENACCDYRDTMLAAEYPGYAKHMFRINTLSAEERSCLRAAVERCKQIFSVRCNAAVSHFNAAVSTFCSFLYVL